MDDDLDSIAAYLSTLNSFDRGILIVIVHFQWHGLDFRN